VRAGVEPANMRRRCGDWSNELPGTLVNKQLLAVKVVHMLTLF